MPVEREKVGWMTASTMNFLLVDMSRNQNQMSPSSCSDCAEAEVVRERVPKVEEKVAGKVGVLVTWTFCPF